MNEGQKSITIESLPLQEVAGALSKTHPFADTPPDALHGVDRVDRIRAQAGAVLVDTGQQLRYYWVVLEGEMRAERQEQDGTRTLASIARSGDGFGETPLLTGKTESPVMIIASQDSLLIRFSGEDFWALLACCPAVRKVVLADMAQRLHTYQVEAIHREKLVSLGTLAAGLMHELHNPGAAAKRAAAQLRENLQRLQELSLSFTNEPKTQLQLECLRALLEHTLKSCHAPAMSSLEQSDAEEAMAVWLESAGVENAYVLAPALVAIGFRQQELVCAQEAFSRESFSSALNWLEALVSSVTQVCAIEESIARISDLVMAVKKFSYDERSQCREVDVHDNLQSTLTILGHKLRLKRITVDKRFQASSSVLRSYGSALSQVWTNLIDNAIDASPENGRLEIATWNEPDWLLVSIADQGEGISAEALPHIFEPFFTTKPQGSGTGLGLEIVHRIVTQKFGGAIQVESKPGNTRFLIRLPIQGPNYCKP